MGFKALKVTMSPRYICATRNRMHKTNYILGHVFVRQIYHYQFKNVRPKKVLDTAKYLVDTSELFRTEGIKV